MNDERTDEMPLAHCVATALAGPGLVRAACDDLDHAAAIRKPGVGKLSAIEHVCHLIEMERDVFGVRLQRILDEDSPRLDAVSMDHFVDPARWQGRTLGDLIEEWEQIRRANVQRVAGAGNDDLDRIALQPDVGRISFLQVVRQWARHDREHVRQLEILARNSRERNLP